MSEEATHGALVMVRQEAPNFEFASCNSPLLVRGVWRGGNRSCGRLKLFFYGGEIGRGSVEKTG